MADVIVDSNLSYRIQESAGMNFGSKVITGGFETWPVGRAVPSSLKKLAAEIFAFDALIQNPDRRAEKPNILWKGDDLYIIDHEMGFSFIYDILPVPCPWKATNMKFMRNHLFHAALKNEMINLDRFIGVLELLSDNDLRVIEENVPIQWRTNSLGKIMGHIRDAAQHANHFADEVRRTLR